MTEKITRLCIIPFRHPCFEPDGYLRLCSAASAYAYSDETIMGHIDDGLGNVWNSEKYKTIRRALLSGEDLPPYCELCEYTGLGPAWVLQFHVAIIIYNQTKDETVLEYIRKNDHRYEIYEKHCKEGGLTVLSVPK